MLKAKKKLIHKYLILTILPRIAFAIPIILIGLRFVVDIKSYATLYFTVISLTVFLEIIYYIVHYIRLKTIFEENLYEDLYRTPLITAAHTFLNFAVFAPIIELTINYFIKFAPLEQFMQGTWTVLAVGLIEFGIVFNLGYLILVPYFKLLKNTSFRGLSITKKMLITLLPVSFFLVYSGYIITISWVGFLYLLLPAFLIYTTIIFIKEPVDSILQGFDKFLSDNPDLSIKLSVVSGDELERIADKFHNFLKVVSGIIDIIKESAIEVNRESENLSAAVQQVTASNQQISGSIQEINSDSQRSKQKIEKIHHNTEELTSIISEINSQMEMLDNTTKTLVDKADSVQKLSKEVMEINNENVEKAEITSSNLEDLKSSFKQAKEFTSMMEQITDDTNLLALNASVEAARTKEEKTGFTVIAEEIRELAVKSSNYLEKMREIIETMNNAVSTLYDANKESRIATKNSSESVFQTIDKLDDINESISLTMNMVEQVKDILTEGMVTIKSIVQGTDTLKDFLQNQAAFTEEIAASIQEQMAAMEESQALSEDLLHLSEKMKDSIENYSE